VEGRGVEEERRLCYVGVTRARDELTLTAAEKRHRFGRLRPGTPSRFLFEMKDLSDHPKLGRPRPAPGRGRTLRQGRGKH